MVGVRVFSLLRWGPEWIFPLVESRESMLEVQPSIVLPKPAQTNYLETGLFKKKKPDL